MKFVSETNKIFGKKIITFSHQPHKNMKKVNAIKNNGIVVHISIQRLFKIRRMFGPMHSLLFMMAYVIAVVPAFHIVFGIDAGDTVFIFISGIQRIYERRL